MPGERKETKDSILFQYFNAFIDNNKLEDIKNLFEEGAGWGDLKKMLYEIINKELSPLREKYEDLMKNPNLVEEILMDGEKKAIIKAEKKIKEIREKVGIKPLNG